MNPFIPPAMCFIFFKVTNNAFAYKSYRYYIFKSYVRINTN